MPVQYGNKVKAFAVMLNNEYKLPIEKVQGVFSDMFGYSINEGTIISANRICYQNLEQTQEAIQKAIIASPSANQVSGHISGVGGSTPGERWCVDVAIGKSVINYNEWTFVAFTYDGHEAKSYYNGMFDAREGLNPYKYELGLFDGGERWLRFYGWSRTPNG